MDQCDLLDDGNNGKNKPASSLRRRYCSTTAVTLLLFLLTNTVSVLVSSGAGASLLRRYRPATGAIIPLWDDSAALLTDLNATQAALAASRAELAGLYARVGTANELLRSLLDAQNHQQQQKDNNDAVVDGWARELAGELKLATIGPSPPSVGHACRRFQDDLEQRYMNYVPGGECPPDVEALEHRLVLGGCDPLPRRRCRPRSPKGYVHPLPLPRSLWAMPPDATVVWDSYYPCKNYSCLLVTNTTQQQGDDGDGCFDLRRGRRRWARDDGALAYSIDAVLRTRPNGTVRVGLDLGSAGTFAARMMERGVTVVTAIPVASDSSGRAPFGSFVAARGLVPLHVGAGHRLPFFDGTLDIVHQLGGGGGWMPRDADGVTLEFALFDVYRVLRPGGLFWIDHLVCPGGAARLNATVTDRVGFKKQRWNIARRKQRRPTGKNDEWYISALLEKPMT